MKPSAKWQISADITKSIELWAQNDLSYDIFHVLAFHLNVTIEKYHKSWPTYTLTNPSQATRLLYKHKHEIDLNESVYYMVHSWSIDFKQCWTFWRFIYRGPFHKWYFASNSNSIEFSPCRNSIASRQIATHCWTCHDGTTIVPCTKVCSDNCIRIEVRVKRNFHGIWCDGKPLVKRSPDLKSSWVDACKMYVWRYTRILVRKWQSLKDTLVVMPTKYIYFHIVRFLITDIILKAGQHHMKRSAEFCWQCSFTSIERTSGDFVFYKGATLRTKSLHKSHMALNDIILRSRDNVIFKTNVNAFTQITRFDKLGATRSDYS